MRTIKFRAKGSGHWRYGQYVHTGQNPSFPFNRDYTDHILYSDNYGIHFIPITDTDTIGQFTGLYDKNHNRIYEGDILRLNDYANVVCMFRHGAFGYVYAKDFHSFAGNTNFTFNPKNMDEDVEIVGNIFDNPELLKGGEE